VLVVPLPQEEVSTAQAVNSRLASCGLPSSRRRPPMQALFGERGHRRDGLRGGGASVRSGCVFQPLLVGCTACTTERLQLVAAVSSSSLDGRLVRPEALSGRATAPLSGSPQCARQRGAVVRHVAPQKRLTQ
ncbi:Molecular chaperone, DnaJ family protein, partial [Giardia duodenalis]